MEDIEDPAFSENTQGQSSFILLPSQEETQQESQVDKQMVKILKKLPALQNPDNPVRVVQSETSDTCTDEELGRGKLVSDTDSVSKTDANYEPSDIASDSDLEEDVTVIQEKSGERTCKTGSEAQKDAKSRSNSQSNGSSFHSQDRLNLGSYDQCEVYRTQEGHAKGDRFDLFPASQDMFEETGDHGCASTPSEHLGSLHLSQKPMLVPETVDETLNEIPPSPGVYGSTPIIIPSSPTQETGNQSVENQSSDLENGNQTVFDVNAAETLASQPKQDYSLQVIEDKEQIEETSRGNKKQTSQSDKISEDDPELGDRQSQSIGLNLAAGTLESDKKTAEETRLEPRQVLPPPPTSQNLMEPESYGSELDVIVIGSGSVSVISEKGVEESDDLALHLSVSEAGTVQGQRSQLHEKTQSQRSQLPEGRASSDSIQFIEVEKEGDVQTCQKTSETKSSSQDNTSEVNRGQGSQERGQSSGSKPRSQEKGQSSGSEPRSQERGQSSGSKPRSQERGQSSGSEPRSQSKKKSKREREIEEMNDHPLVEWKNDSDVERKEEMSVKSTNRFSDEFHLAVPGLMSEPEPFVAREPGVESVQKSCSSRQPGTSQRTSSQPQPAQEHLKDSVIEVKLGHVSATEEGRDRLSIGMIQSESEHTEPVFKLQKPQMEELNLLDESEDVFPRTAVRQKGTPRLIIEDSDEDDVNPHTGDTEKIVSTDIGDKSAGLDKTEETFIATKLDIGKVEESSELTQSYHADVNVLTDTTHQPSEHLEITGEASAAVKTVGTVRERRLTESSTQTADGKVNEAFEGDINVVQKVAEYLQSGYSPRSRSNSTCTDLSDLHGDGSDKGDNLMKTPHRKDRTDKLKTQTPKSPQEIKTIIRTYSDILSKSQKHKQKHDDKLNLSSQKPNPTEADRLVVGKLAPRRLSSQSLPEDLLRGKSQNQSGSNVVVTDPWLTTRKVQAQSSVDIDSKSDKLSELNSPRKETSGASETGVTQQLSESFRPENQHVGMSQENVTFTETGLSHDKLNKCQDVVGGKFAGSKTEKKKLHIDIARKMDEKNSSCSENTSCAEKLILTPSKQKKPVVQTSLPCLSLEMVDSPKIFNDSAKQTNSAKANVPHGNENDHFVNKTYLSSSTPNKQKKIDLKPTETWTVATEKPKTVGSKQESSVLSDRVVDKELVEEKGTDIAQRDHFSPKGSRENKIAQDKEVAVSQNSQKKGKDNTPSQFVTEQTLETEISASHTKRTVKPYYCKSLRSKRKVKRRLSAEKRNSLHRQAGGHSSQVVSDVVSLPIVSSRVSPQIVSGSFVASTQNFSPNHGTDAQDPYSFHGTQSQSSPVKKNPDNTDGTPGKTPVSSRKRTRLQHKKSGLKKAKLDTEDVENSSHNKHHVSFQTSPRISSQSSDTTVTTIGSLPSIPSSISLSSPIRETVLSPTSSSSRQSVSEEISTRLSGKRMSIEQALPDTLPLTHSEEDNYQKVTVVIEKVERVYREITTTRKVIGPEGQILENTQEVKRLDPVVVEENTHKKIQYVYIPSPSRSVSSLTSGDLADVSSSLSRSSVSSGSLGSKIGSLSSSLDRNPSVTKHLETQISHEYSQADHGESAKSSKPGAEKSNTGEIMAAPSSVPRTKLHRLSSGNVQDNQSVTVRKSTEQHSQALENQTNNLTGIQPHTPETLSTGYQKGHTPGLITGLEHRSKPSTPAVHSDQEISDVQTPLGSTINKTSSYLHSRTSSVDSPKTSDSLFSTSSDENKKSASNLDAGRSIEKANEESRPETKESGSSDQISSEIPYQDQHVSSSQSVTPEEPVALTTSDGSIGSKVMARWKDGFSYPGTLKSTADRYGRHMVHFDDGSKMSVKGADILLIERLPVGQSVMVLTEEGDFESGLITKIDEDSYTVETDEGKSGRYTSSQAILSSDQAKCVISDHGKDVIMSNKKPSCVPTNVGDVSLENLLDSPRRSSKKNTASVDVKVDEEGQGQSGKGRKRKHDGLKPQATSTPTPKGKSESLLSKRRKMLIDSPVSGIQSSPVPVVKKLPRKTRLGLFGKELGPIPTKKMFRNIYFLLTNVEKSTEQLDQEKKLIKDSSLDTSTDDSATEEEASVPFDKEHLKQQIEAGGGTVLDSFSESLISKGKRRVVLLSSTYQRTIKYLQCLACGIPCLSHMWVVDSCTQEHLLDEKSYLLPAGISLEKKKIMEWRKKNNVFQGIKAVVFSKNSKFVDSWTQILSLAQCHVHSKVQYEDVHVIVTDDSCTAAVHRGGESNCVPIVGTEWVIQCLVNGRLMSYKGHPRYKHDYLT